MTDLDRAQGIAEAEYSIPKLLDAIDIHECPDELSMMTYISYFRDWWLDDWKRREAALEAERLRKMRTADPSQCYAFGPGVEGGITNQQAPFTIQAVNYFGDPLPTGGDDFVIQLTGPETLKVSRQDNNNGTHTCGYLPMLVGTYNLAISLRGEPIKGSPYKPFIDGCDHQTSGFAGFTFTIQTRDKNGHNKTFGGDDFAVIPSDPSVHVKTKDNGDGTYSASFSLDKKGQNTFKVLFNGRELAASPLHVNL